MAGNESLRYRFVFHGSAGKFFWVCLINVLLTMVTLGIYLPWALVRSRRYIYENMELRGVFFKYHATGGALFGSFFLLMLFLIVGSIVCNVIHSGLGVLPLLIFILLLPLMVIKGLRFQAMMTTLNNVRFGFQCGFGKAMWVLLGLPVLMAVAGAIVICLLNLMLGIPLDMNGVIIHLVVMVLAILLILGIINGVSYGKWMQLLGNHARFGIHSFNIAISIKRCILMSVVSMLMLLPFLIVIGKLIAPVYRDMMFLASTGGLNEELKADIMLQYQKEILVSYLLYFTAILLVATFSFTVMRNIFINGLQLANGIHFYSSVTFINMLAQIVTVALVTGLTLGLAYPWAKIRFLRYLASHTEAIGDLDTLELVDSDEPLDKGLLAAVSRGIVPAIPFV